MHACGGIRMASLEAGLSLPQEHAATLPPPWPAWLMMPMGALGRGASLASPGQPASLPGLYGHGKALPGNKSPLLQGTKSHVLPTLGPKGCMRSVSLGCAGCWGAVGRWAAPGRVLGWWAAPRKVWVGGGAAVRERLRRCQPKAARPCLPAQIVSAQRPHKWLC